MILYQLKSHRNVKRREPHYGYTLKFVIVICKVTSLFIPPRLYLDSEHWINQILQKKISYAMQIMTKLGPKYFDHTSYHMKY